MHSSEKLNETEKPIPDKKVGLAALLAGNFLALIAFAVIVAISTRSSEPPTITVTSMFVALGVIFVVPATLFIERPLLRRLKARPRPFSVPEELMVIALSGAALSVPGGIVGTLITAFEPDYDYWDKSFAFSFAVGAIIFGAAGIWCALLGRLVYLATRRSKVITVLIFGAVALAMAWSLIVFLGNYF